MRADTQTLDLKAGHTRGVVGPSSRTPVRARAAVGGAAIATTRREPAHSGHHGQAHVCSAPKAPGLPMASGQALKGPAETLFQK